MEHSWSVGSLGSSAHELASRRFHVAGQSGSMQNLYRKQEMVSRVASRANDQAIYDALCLKKLQVDGSVEQLALHEAAARRKAKRRKALRAHRKRQYGAAVLLQRAALQFIEARRGKAADILRDYLSRWTAVLTRAHALYILLRTLRRYARKHRNTRVRQKVITHTARVVVEEAVAVGAWRAHQHHLAVYTQRQQRSAAEASTAAVAQRGVQELLQRLGRLIAAARIASFVERRFFAALRAQVLRALRKRPKSARERHALRQRSSADSYAASHTQSVPSRRKQSRTERDDKHAGKEEGIPVDEAQLWAAVERQRAVANQHRRWQAKCIEDARKRRMRIEKERLKNREESVVKLEAKQQHGTELALRKHSFVEGMAQLHRLQARRANMLRARREQLRREEERQQAVEKAPLDEERMKMQREDMIALQARRKERLEVIRLRKRRSEELKRQMELTQETRRAQELAQAKAIGDEAVRLRLVQRRIDMQIAQNELAQKQQQEELRLRHFEESYRKSMIESRRRQAALELSRKEHEETLKAAEKQQVDEKRRAAEEAARISAEAHSKIVRAASARRKHLALKSPRKYSTKQQLRLQEAQALYAGSGIGLRRKRQEKGKLSSVVSLLALVQKARNCLEGTPSPAVDASMPDITPRTPGTAISRSNLPTDECAHETLYESIAQGSFVTENVEEVDEEAAESTRILTALRAALAIDSLSPQATAQVNTVNVVDPPEETIEELWRDGKNVAERNGEFLIDMRIGSEGEKATRRSLDSREEHSMLQAILGII